MTNIFTVSEEKKNQYWNHFVAQALTGETSKPSGVTGPRLRKIKPVIWQDAAFWFDIVPRHGGDKCTPEEMARDDPNQYEHAMGNFWSMIVESLHMRGFKV